MDLTLICSEGFVRDGRSQIDLRRDDDGASQKTVQSLDLRRLGGGGHQDSDGNSPLGNDHPFQLSARDPIENIQTLSLELGGIDGPAVAHPHLHVVSQYDHKL
jgi:hypothetical protein